VNKINTKTVFIALVACAISAACSPLAPQPDRSKFFILTPLADSPVLGSTPAAASNDSALTIGVGPIDFPDYLRRPEVVTLASPNQLDLAAEKRWGEPLDKDFGRVFAENISRLLNTQQLEKYPWPVRTQVNYQIVIDVQRFETTSDGQSELVARWIIKDGAGKDLYASETRASAPVAAGETGPSKAMSEDLATLSREIAARVSELHARQAPANTTTSNKNLSQATSRIMRERPNYQAEVATK
jgi:uncharacterized protein